MDPFQDPGSSSQSRVDTDDQMSSAPGRKRVGFTSEVPAVRPFSTQSPDEDTGSAGHNTPLQRSDVSHDDLQKMRESLRLALGDENDHGPQQAIIPPKEVQKPRPAIRKGPRTPPEFYLNDQPSPFDDVAAVGPSLGAEVKERSGLAAQRRATKLSKSVGTFSAPGSRRGSQELLASPPVELRNMARAYETGGETTDDDDEDPQFLKRASMLLRQHTLRAAGPAISSEDLYHTDASLRSGQVTPEAIDLEDEHVSRPSKYRTGVLGTLLKASNAAQATAPSRPGHARNLSAGTFSGASTAANSPNSSPPASGYSTPRGGRSWFNRHHASQSATSISQLVGSSAHSFATPARKELGQEFDELYKKSRPGLGNRSRSEESLMPFKKVGKRRDNEIKIKIHL